MIPAQPPDPTPEFDALTPLPGESGMDALARVGQSIVAEVNPDDARPDTSRKPGPLPRQLAAFVALRAQGFDNHEIAEKLGVTKRQLSALFKKAEKDYGWSDMSDRLAHRAVPQAMENLVKHLEHESTKVALKKGQNVVTLKTLQGTGLLRSHSAVKQETTTTQTNILRVEIVIPTLPPGAPLTAGVFATPRQILPVIDVEQP